MLCSPLSCLFSCRTSWNSLFCSDNVALGGECTWKGANGGGVEGLVKCIPIWFSPLSSVFSCCTSWNTLSCTGSDEIFMLEEKTTLLELSHAVAHLFCLSSNTTQLSQQ